MAYALITGASRGIGKAMAEQLARKGHALLLIARSEDLLKDYANELSLRYKIPVDYFAIDLARPAAAQEIFDWCRSKDIEIDILINNAGYGLNGLLEDYSLEEYLKMMQVNMSSLVSLTYLFLPGLKKMPGAHIGNIASGAAYQAVPGLNVYAATKAFVLSFSRGLSYELKKTSVSVTCICPGATDTNFAARANVTSEKAVQMAKKFNMDPAVVAQISVEGILAGKTEVVPGLVNKLTRFFSHVLPDSLLEKSAAGIYGL
ncbi:MAG: SDR family oxidoreductase [Sphingobacteriia bacterium]|nr:SDR family oxidoreductase [Sphingobacteriia bacterium]